MRRYAFLFFVLILVGISLIRILTIRNPKVIPNKQYEIFGEVEGFPSISSKFIRATIRIQGGKEEGEYLKGSSIQIYTNNRVKIERGDKLYIIGKINNKSTMFYPMYSKITEDKNKVRLASTQLRRFIEFKIEQRYSSDSAILAEGMLLGTNREMSSELKSALRSNGTIHMIVVSGYNVTVISTLILVVCKNLKRYLALALSGAVVILYVLMSGAEPPVVRAGIMAIIAIIGSLYGRQVDTVYTLILAGLAMVIYHPSYIYSLSFQLSFLATLGVVSFTPRVQRGINWLGKSVLRKAIWLHRQWVVSVGKVIRDEMAVSLAAQVAIIPIISMQFGNISLLAPITNIFVGWTVPYIMAGTALSVVFSEISTMLGLFCISSTNLITAYFTQMNIGIYRLLSSANANFKFDIVLTSVYYTIILLIWYKTKNKIDTQ